MAQTCQIQANAPPNSSPTWQLPSPTRHQALQTHIPTHGCSCLPNVTTSLSCSIDPGARAIHLNSNQDGCDSSLAASAPLLLLPWLFRAVNMAIVSPLTPAGISLENIHWLEPWYLSVILPQAFVKLAFHDNNSAVSFMLLLLTFPLLELDTTQTDLNPSRHLDRTKGELIMPNYINPNVYGMCISAEGVRLH